MWAVALVCFGCKSSEDVPGPTVIVHITATPTPSPTPVPVTEVTTDSNVGDIVIFNDSYWQVLDKEDNNLLIISYDVIEQREYSGRRGSNLWEDSDIREYLNGEYYESFEPEYRDMILLSEVHNNDNVAYEEDGGSVTNDYIFLLSTDEAREYFQYNSQRIGRLDGNAVPWMLRSPGYREDATSYVHEMGFINYNCYVGDDSFGIRPSMWICVE